MIWLGACFDGVHWRNVVYFQGDRLTFVLSEFNRAVSTGSHLEEDAGT